MLSLAIFDQAVESEPVLPGLREVLGVDMLVSVRSSLLNVDLDLLDLEAEDDRPDEAEDHPGVPSTISSAPIFSSRTLVWRKASDLLTFSILQFGIFQDNRTHSSTISYLGRELCFNDNMC